MNTSNSCVIHFEECKLILGISGGNPVQFHLPLFQANKSELWALTGPSGCGKSTLLNLASGLLLPSNGQVHVLGQNLSTMRAYQRDIFRGKHTGFVYQSFNLLDGFTAFENVMMGMRFGRVIPKQERKERAMQVLHEVGLEHRVHQMPAKLSIGERQRVAIARAVVNRPGILLADEPTGSLDPVTAAGVFDLLIKICEEEQCTLLMVTHDLDLAAKLPHQFDCRGLVTHTTSRGAAA
jgi:ABC-type lipoprotein export system ATPase subunit